MGSQKKRAHTVVAAEAGIAGLAVEERERKWEASGAGMDGLVVEETERSGGTRSWHRSSRGGERGAYRFHWDRVWMDTRWEERECCDCIRSGHGWSRGRWERISVHPSGGVYHGEQRLARPMDPSPLPDINTREGM